MELIEALVLLNLILTLISLLLIGYALLRTTVIAGIIKTMSDQEIMTRQLMQKKEEQHVMTPVGPMPLSVFKKNFDEEDTSQKNDMFG